MFFRSVFSFLATIVTLTYNIEQKELKKKIPNFELGSLFSNSSVLTITP